MVGDCVVGRFLECLVFGANQGIRVWASAFVAAGVFDGAFAVNLFTEVVAGYGCCWAGTPLLEITDGLATGIVGRFFECWIDWTCKTL